MTPPASLKCIAIGLLMSVTATSPALAQIVWSFTADSAATAAPTSGLPDTLTGGAISVFQSGGTPDINTTSASSGYTGASGSHNFSAGSAPAGEFSPTGSAFFAFTLTPTPGSGVNATSLTLGSRSTSTGPITLSLYSSSNAFGSAISTLATTTGSWALLDFGAFDITTSAGNALTFRIYGSDGSGTGSGNWRIDDITLIATAVPEPSTYAFLIGAGVLGFAGFRRLRARLAPPSRRSAIVS